MAPAAPHWWVLSRCSTPGTCPQPLAVRFQASVCFIAEPQPQPPAGGFQAIALPLSYTPRHRDQIHVSPSVTAVPRLATFTVAAPNSSLTATAVPLKTSSTSLLRDYLLQLKILCTFFKIQVNTQETPYPPQRDNWPCLPLLTPLPHLCPESFLPQRDDGVHVACMAWVLGFSC